MPVISFNNPGFGFERPEEAKTLHDYIRPLQRKPHNYGVKIGLGVELGDFCVIDAGSWRTTEIGEGTKLDSDVKIAHNVIVGKQCLIVAGVSIAGSCNIGDRCYIGMNACILDRITIGNDVIIGAGAIVTKDVPDGWTVIGNPARRLIKDE